MQAIFREELKCVVPKWKIPSLREDVRRFLKEDKNASAVGNVYGYRVRSLYFETNGFQFLSEKTAGISDRFKLRIRSYFPISRDRILIAEIKIKKGTFVRKERTVITPAILECLVHGQHAQALFHDENNSVLRKFVSAKATLGAVVPLIIDYNRESYHHPCEALYVRLTIDTNISAMIQSDFFDNEKTPHPLTQAAVVEMKFQGTLPYWMNFLIEKHHLSVQSISKFEKACRLFGVEEN